MLLIDVNSDTVEVVEYAFNACKEEVVERMVEVKKTTLEMAKLVPFPAMALEMHSIDSANDSGQIIK